MSPTISRSESNKNKKDLNSWIKVLRPKVYITDSSSFKSLVQELTGNGSSSSLPIPPTSSSATTATTSPPLPGKAQMVEIQDDYYPQVEPESSTDVTLDVSVDDSSDDQYWYSSHLQVLLTSHDDDHQDHYHDDNHQVYNQITNLGDTSLEDWTTMNEIQDLELLDYHGGAESWLVDVDDHLLHPCSSYKGHVQSTEQEVSIYDYELSGLL